MPPDLQRRLRRALMNNAYFQTDRNLRVLLANNTRLQPWRHSLPEATRVNIRVNCVIADLLNKWNPDQQNALYLLLHVLYEQEGDLELQHLAKEVCLTPLNDQLAEWQRELTRLKKFIPRLGVTLSTTRGAKQSYARRFNRQRNRNHSVLKIFMLRHPATLQSQKLVTPSN